MLPWFTSYFALLGIALVLCAGALHFLSQAGSGKPWAKWLALLVFAALWLPVGAVQLPVAAYIRGVSSDLSITLVALAGVRLLQGMWGWPAIGRRDIQAMFACVALAALLLYPMALGLGDWDPYRLGWNSPGMWLVLLAVVAACWAAGLRLLPSLIALALLGWSIGLLESANLWDYLLDPWLSALAFVYSIKACAARMFGLYRGRRTTLPP